MEVDKKMIESAIEIVKENRQSFDFDLLKRDLRIGVGTCNRLLNELEKAGIIKQHNKNGGGKYKIEILI